MSCPSPKDMKNNHAQKKIASVVIEIVTQTRAYPATVSAKNTEIPELLKEIQRLYNINKRMPEFTTDFSETPSLDVINGLIEMSKKHPMLLEAVLDESREEWSQESALDLLHEKCFNEHPDAVLEVLNGGHWKAAAIKRDLLQL